MGSGSSQKEKARDFLSGFTGCSGGWIMRGMIRFRGC